MRSSGTQDSKYYSAISQHISGRFKQLRDMLDSNPELKIIIAGEENNLTEGYEHKDGDNRYIGARGHRLGVGLAYGQWLEKSNKDEWLKMVKLIDAEVNSLFDKYPTRVSCGRVGDKNAEDECFVWGANAGNWNFDKGTTIGGGGQASYIGRQRTGVFGIVTTPLDGIDNIECEKFTAKHSWAKPSVKGPVATSKAQSSSSPQTTNSSNPNYQVLISQETAQKIVNYKNSLSDGKRAGAYFQNELDRLGKTPATLSNGKFLELLIQTKKPQIFAESAVYGDGRDWNATELSILGDINFAVPVNIYDNGVHNGTGIKSHTTPFQGELLFVPGALLTNAKGITTPDMLEVAPNGTIDDEAFYRLYERRLLPSLLHANDKAVENGAFVTIPGMGCGVFAGKFKGHLETKFQRVLIRLLETHGSQLKNIKGINFDPNEPQFTSLDGTKNINGIELTTKTGKFGAENSQLKKPGEYNPKFAKCKFFSVVAWDHVSWPGNDFYVGGRQTDDGVKAAATDVCARMTGVAGTYDHNKHKFQPPAGFQNWNGVIEQKRLQLHTQENLDVFNLVPTQSSNKTTPKSPSTTTNPTPSSVRANTQIVEEYKNIISEWTDHGFEDHDQQLKRSYHPIIKEIKSALKKQESEAIPNGAYVGIGIEADKVTLNGKQALKIKDVFAPEKARFYLGADNRLRTDIVDQMKGLCIVAVTFNNNGETITQSIDDLIKKDQTMSNIAKIFHSGSSNIKFTVQDESGKNTEIGCVRKEHQCFVTNNCRLSQTLPRGKGGDIYYPRRYGFEPLGGDEFLQKTILAVNPSPQSHTEALSRERFTREKVSNFTIYSAKKHADEKPRLAITFSSIEERGAFIRKFPTLPISVVGSNKTTLYIEPSNGQGTNGTFASRNGELSVSFENRTVRDDFCKALGIHNDHASLPKQDKIGNNAIYFKPEKLPLQPDGKINIQTKVAASLVR